VTRDKHFCLTQRNFSKGEKVRKLVAMIVRIQNSIYILNEIGKENESWIWHRRMVHMKFDNLFKINKKEAVRQMPEISKPTNTMCKHFLHGKQASTKLRSNTLQQIHC
jgi:hypothetical protein